MFVKDLKHNLFAVKWIMLLTYGPAFSPSETKIKCTMPVNDVKKESATYLLSRRFYQFLGVKLRKKSTFVFQFVLVWCEAQLGLVPSILGLNISVTKNASSSVLFRLFASFKSSIIWILWYGVVFWPISDHRDLSHIRTPLIMDFRILVFAI